MLALDMDHGSTIANKVLYHYGVGLADSFFRPSSVLYVTMNVSFSANKTISQYEGPSLPFEAVPTANARVLQSS